MREEYKETGGLRWGLGFWTGVNVSWPFAHLVASSERVQIRMSLLGIWSRVFNFSRHEIKSIKRKHGLWSVGIVIEHTKMDYPPFILFWTFNYRSLKEAMAKLGYDIIDDGN